MALKFHTDMITISNSDHLRITLTAPSRPHCDNCAADLPTYHLRSSIEGELVRLCCEYGSVRVDATAITPDQARQLVALVRTWEESSR